MASWEFPGSDPIDLDATVASGEITVTAEPTDATVVVVGSPDDDPPSDLQVSFADGRLVLSQPRQFSWRRRDGHDIAVTLPAGSRCTIRSADADVSCRGELGSLQARTASGGITAQVVAGPVTAVTASGDVRLDEARSSASISTASGDIWLARADGDVQSQTASGQIDIGTAAGSLSAKTASGDVQLGSVRSGQVKMVSVSGDLDVGIAAGTGVYLDLSAMTGQLSSELDQSDEQGVADLRLSCRTVSGSIRVRRASPVS